MMDSRRKQLIEEFDEANIKLLMDEYESIEGVRLWHEYLNALENQQIPEISQALDRRCKQLIYDKFMG